jgi:hypothetical protein
MNLTKYTDPIDEQLESIRQSVAVGSFIPQSRLKRVRKAVARLHDAAVRDINIRSSRDARHRSFLRDAERVVLLERLAAFVECATEELDRAESAA